MPTNLYFYFSLLKQTIIDEQALRLIKNDCELPFDRMLEKNKPKNTRKKKKKKKNKKNPQKKKKKKKAESLAINVFQFLASLTHSNK